MDTEQREGVCQALLDNARAMSAEHQAEIEAWNPVKAGGREFIPGYIPYIGCDYFRLPSGGPRILAYALSQNVRETDDFARQWAHDWDKGLDRQNQERNWAAMHPFDTGHIPILASLLRSQVLGRKPKGEESIYREIAATNLSKFSFRSSDGKRTTDNETSLRRCWEWFSRLEVEKLDPDFILCCGERVYAIVREELLNVSQRPTVIRVAFPSLLVINRHYHRSKPFRAEHLRAEDLLELVSAADGDRPVDHGQTIAQIIERDAYYFAEMLVRMVSQC